MLRSDGIVWGNGSRGGHTGRQQGSLQFNGTKLLIELSYKTAGGIYGIVGVKSTGENRTMCRVSELRDVEATFFPHPAR